MEVEENYTHPRYPEVTLSLGRLLLISHSTTKCEPIGTRSLRAFPPKAIHALTLSVIDTGLISRGLLGWISHTQ
jgi:hypothetical protein